MDIDDSGVVTFSAAEDYVFTRDSLLEHVGHMAELMDRLVEIFHKAGDQGMVDFLLE